MKLLNALIFLTVLSFNSIGQTAEDHLLKVYTVEELKEIKSSSNENYDLLVYSLTNGLIISDLPEGKTAKLDGEVTLPNGNYNFADLGLKISERNQYFKIVGTNKMLTVKSFYTLKNEKNEN